MNARFVSFAVGGVPDAVDDGLSGHLVDAGDYPVLSDRIISLLNRPAAEKETDSLRSLTRNTPLTP